MNNNHVQREKLTIKSEVRHFGDEKPFNTCSIIERYLKWTENKFR